MMMTASLVFLQQSHSGFPGWFDAAAGSFVLISVVLLVIVSRSSPDQRLSWLDWVSLIGATAAGIGFLLWNRPGPSGLGHILATVGLPLWVVAGLLGDIVRRRRAKYSG